MYMPVSNACTRIVYFLHIYHACDVLSLLLYIMRGRPFVVVSLHALYSASRPISLRASLLHGSLAIITLICMLVLY